MNDVNRHNTINQNLTEVRVDVFFNVPSLAYTFSIVSEALRVWEAALLRFLQVLLSDLGLNFLRSPLVGTPEDVFHVNGMLLFQIVRK